MQSNERSENKCIAVNVVPFSLIENEPKRLAEEVDFWPTDVFTNILSG